MANRKKNITWQVIEDSGGGLYLFVFESGKAIYAHGGYEGQSGHLSEDIHALATGADVSDWDGNMVIGSGIDLSDEETPEQLYNGMTSQEVGWAIVADTDGIYPDRMGAAAQEELKVPPEMSDCF